MWKREKWLLKFVSKRGLLDGWWLRPHMWRVHTWDVQVCPHTGCVHTRDVRMCPHTGCVHTRDVSMCSHTGHVHTQDVWMCPHTGCTDVSTHGTCPYAGFVPCHDSVNFKKQRKKKIWKKYVFHMNVVASFIEMHVIVLEAGRLRWGMAFANCVVKCRLQNNVF